MNNTDPTTTTTLWLNTLIKLIDGALAPLVKERAVHHDNDQLLLDTGFDSNWQGADRLAMLDSRIGRLNQIRILAKQTLTRLDAIASIPLADIVPDWSRLDIDPEENDIPLTLRVPEGHTYQEALPGLLRYRIKDLILPDEPPCGTQQDASFT